MYTLSFPQIPGFSFTYAEFAPWSKHHSLGPIQCISCFDFQRMHKDFSGIIIIKNHVGYFVEEQLQHVSIEKCTVCV